MPVYLKRYISKDAGGTAVTNAYKYTPQQSKLLQEKGELFAHITVSKTPQGYAAKGTKFVWDSVLDSYYSSKSGAITEDLKKALSAGSKKLLELIRFDKEIAKQGIDLSFAILVLKESTAYIGIFGEQEVYIIKGSQWINISEILLRNKAVAASIAIALEDVVVIASPESLNKISKHGSAEQLSRSMEADDSILDYGQCVIMLGRKKIGTQEESEKDEPEIEPVVVPLDEVEETEEISEVVEPEVSQMDPTLGISEETASFKERFQTVLLNLKDLGARIRSTLMLLWNRFTLYAVPAWKGVQKMFGKLGNRILGLFENRYGRKLWFKRIKSRFPLPGVGSGSGAYGMKVDGYKETALRGKRIWTVIAIVGVIAFILFAYNLSMKARSARELHKEAVAIMDTVENYITQAESSFPADMENAGLAKFNASEELKKLEDKKLSLADSKSLTDLRNRYQAIDDKIARRVGVSEEDESFGMFLDLSVHTGLDLASTDITISRDENQSEFLFVVDTALAGVYKVNIFDKAVNKLPDANGVLKKPVYVDMGNKGVYVYDEQVGVVRARYDGKGGFKDFETLTGLGRDDLGVDDVKEFAIFAETDNVFLLSQSMKSVLKAVYFGSGYGLPAPYMNSELFAGATDFFGDNISVYIVTQGAEGIRRYSGPDENPVTIDGLDPVLSSPTAGYTGSSLDNLLYLYDSDGNRFLAFEKPMEGAGQNRHPNKMLLKHQFVYKGKKEDVLKNVSDFVVDYTEKYMYILDGATIQRMKLK